MKMKGSSKNSNALYYALIIFILVGVYFIFRQEKNKPKVTQNHPIEIEFSNFINTNNLEGALLANAANEMKDLGFAEELYKEALKKSPKEIHYKVYYNLGCT